MNTAETEASRLQDLYDLEILDTVYEEAYAGLVNLLAACTGCSMAMISFMDKDRQWVKSGMGIPFTEWPREHALCNLTLQEKGLIVSEDTILDKRFIGNPYISGADAVRFYAGLAFPSVNGHNLGTVCIMAKEPKALTPVMRQTLNVIAGQVCSLLELRRKDQQLRAVAIKQIELEKATIQRHIRQQEEERELVGYELHEHYAQTIAACLQYISLCKGADALEEQYINKVKKTLLGLTESMRQLSLTIFPLGSAGVIQEDVLERYIEYFNDFVNFPIFYSCSGNLNEVSPKSLLSAFRIMVDQLHTFESIQMHGSEVYVHVSIADELVVEIKAKGLNYFQGSPETSIVENSISKRTQLISGKSKFVNEGPLGRLLRVALPL